MELFSVIVTNASQPYVSSLCELMIKELKHLHNERDGVQLRYEQFEHYAVITGTAALPGFELHKSANEIYNCLGVSLAEHILKFEERAIMRDLIKREFKYEQPNEIDTIEGYCNQFLYGEPEPLLSEDEVKSRRKKRIAEQVKEYFQENTDMILEGFLRFRLQDYVEDMREVVEYAIDEFVMDRQYQEFISLLRYFVYIQEAKIPVAHLIHKGGHEFVILNDQLEPIDTQEFESSFTLEVLEKDINFEDMIVSTLITVSPANIHIHTREPEMAVIKTIMQIFEERATVCPYCRMCHAFLGDVKKQDQLYP